MTTRRYIFRGPELEELRNELDPGLTIVLGFVLAIDVTFDETVALASAVDAALARLGWMFDATITAAGIGLVTPSGDVRALQVDNLGVLSTAIVGVGVGII